MKHLAKKDYIVEYVKSVGMASALVQPPKASPYHSPIDGISCTIYTIHTLTDQTNIFIMAAVMLPVHGAVGNIRSKAIYIIQQNGNMIGSWSKKCPTNSLWFEAERLMGKTCIHYVAMTAPYQ